MPALEQEMAGQRVSAPGPDTERSVSMPEQTLAKACTRCGETKSLTDFHVNRARRDGRQAVCKECIRAKNATAEARAFMRDSYWRTREQRLVRDRERAKRRWREGKRRTDTEHEKVRHALRRAVQRGEVVKPGECEDCGIEPEPHLLHGHHDDYSKPLEVAWLCTRCHGLRHREEGR